MDYITANVGFGIFFIMAVLVGLYFVYKASGRFLTCVENNHLFGAVMFGIIMCINGIGVVVSLFLTITIIRTVTGG